MIQGNPIFGDVFIDFIDSQAQTILQLLHLDADTLPIFVTDNVTAEALGYHTAYPIQDDDNGTQLQTFIYTSWLDPALVPPIFADVSTFNHELAEWMNDPFTNNATPDWYYPPPTDPATVCSQNPFLEVGDPQGNGPTYTDFPAFESKIDGVTYHLQQLYCGNGSRIRCLPARTAAGTRFRSRRRSKCRPCTARKARPRRSTPARRNSLRFAWP